MDLLVFVSYFLLVITFPFSIWFCFTVSISAANRSIGSTTGCTITEKAPTRAFSWLKVKRDGRVG